MEEGAGEWRRHRKNSEHTDKTNQRVNPNLSKNNMLFLSCDFRFIGVKRRSYGDAKIRVGEVICFLVDRFFLVIGVA